MPLVKSEAYSSEFNTYTINRKYFCMAFSGYEGGLNINCDIPEDRAEGVINELAIPSYVYISKFTIDSIRLLQNLILKLKDSCLTESAKNSINRALAEIIILCFLLLLRVFTCPWFTHWYLSLMSRGILLQPILCLFWGLYL